jgi:hypothetical protein
MAAEWETSLFENESLCNDDLLFSQIQWGCPSLHLYLFAILFSQVALGTQQCLAAFFINIFFYTAFFASRNFAWVYLFQ